MKTFIAIVAIVASFILGILIGYYYRNISVEEEIWEKLRQQEKKENKRRKEENDRLLEIINSNTTDWKEKWEEYIREETISNYHPV